MTHGLRFRKRSPFGLLLLLGMASRALAFGPGDPEFYGAIEVGHGPIPQLVYPGPVSVAPQPYGAPLTPLYLRVPPRVWRHWPRYCMQYQACARPVYFVKEAWYRQVYMPYYREHPEFWHREGERHDGFHRGEGRWHQEEHPWEGEHRREEH